MTDVFLLDPVAVGFVRWRDTERATTLVVKATFALGAESAPTPTEPDPLWLGDGEAGHLDGASDFAPRKARVDVLIGGHVVTPSPVSLHASTISSPDWARTFVARSPERTTRFSLARGDLRESARAHAARVVVGPLAPRDPARVLLAGDVTLDDSGVPTGPLPPSFDFGWFNAADREQQLDELPPWIRIDGIRSLASREIWLGARWPFGVGVRGRGVAEEIAFTCDTVAIDLDRDRISLVWRAVLRAAEEIEWVAVALAPPDQPPSTGDLIASSLDAHRIPGAEVPTVSMEIVDARSETSPMLALGLGRGPSPAAFDPLPATTRRPADTLLLGEVDDPTPHDADEEIGTSTVTLGPTSQRGALPFASAERRTTALRGLASDTPFAPPVTSSLPFRPAVGSAPSLDPPPLLAPPLAPPPAPPLAPARMAPSFVEHSDSNPPAPPFVTTSGSFPIAPAPSGIVAQPAAQPAPITGPSPSAIVEIAAAPSPSPPSTPLARYAEARVAIETGEPVHDVLKLQGFEEGTWAKHHRRMLLRARRDPEFEVDLATALNEARKNQARGAAKAARRR